MTPEFHAKDWQPLQSYSKTHLKKQAEIDAAEADWLSSLRSTQQKEGIFSRISQVNDSDHEHVKDIKGRIANLLN